MKVLNVFIAGMLLMLSTVATAQTKTGFEYFKGKWNVVVDAPTGNVAIVVAFEKSGDAIVGTMKDSEGTLMFEVVKTTVKETQAILNFIGSQGEVAMVLNKKDDDHIAGDVMEGIASASGVRVTEKK